MKAVLALIGALMTMQLAFAEDESSEKQRAVYHTMNPAFVSNFGEPRRKLSYVKAEISLKVESEEHVELVKHHAPLIRHQIVMLLSEQSKEGMSSHTAQETIRLAALSRVKEALAEEVGKTGVQDLLFTSFVVQI
ncbi:hypothetical protein A3715_12390 [Oleiphilus sp. HI0009]|uniref:flagellar basal body-associated FliL family protein n=3 Tax=Oleiphilus TaxID=141450 RepID=UPI0007C243C0|nr:MULTISPECIES: flagellar basal body-associated FliL family protein [unclassified Oleiphilus]KZX76829.1 hypothetical protein A3715_12390 [Oleiphilus sp. HI0009]KZY64884.1 hypothetical protein A3738_09860 [Oleiphilus sp. HI0066]KZY71479.1 hypothetical protein A3739_04575 [Oleiphilus sp. HI0067]KZZ58345.1 hypothetical protein A3762_00875 [Oleiphilus sp. HI0125]